jgi:hypothetical protein
MTVKLQGEAGVVVVAKGEKTIGKINIEDIIDNNYIVKFKYLLSYSNC